MKRIRKALVVLAWSVCGFLLVTPNATAQTVPEPAGIKQCFRYLPSVRRVAGCLVVTYGVSLAIKIAEAYGLEEVLRYLKALIGSGENRQQDPAPPLPR